MSDDTHGLVTPELFTALTGRTAPSQDALDAALDVVEGYCKWPVIQTTRTIEIESFGSRILGLPGMNVTDVATVSVSDDWTGSTVVPPWRKSTTGFLKALRGCWPVGVVTVTFTSGYPPYPTPGGVWLTVAALADRLQLQAGVTQRLESAGGISTNTSYGGMAGFMLDNQDLAVALDPYRLIVAP